MDSVVYKAKYEDTLRRFHLGGDDGHGLNLTMEYLRLKICSLFNLALEADICLTYYDEDGDLVTLGDDEDLHDIVNQDLDPVRIMVHLNSVKSAQTGTSASGSSTPSQPSSLNVQPNISSDSPNVAEVLKSIQEPLSRILQKLGSSSQSAQQSANPDVAEIVKAVQEALTRGVSELSLEMVLKAASASPVLADIFDGLSKLGHSYLNASKSESGAVNLSSHNEAGNESRSNSDGRSVEASVAEGMKNDDIDRPGPSQLVNKSTQSTEGATPVRPPLWSSFLYDKGKNGTCDPFSDKSSNGDAKKNKFVSEGCAGIYAVTDWNRDAKTWISAQKEPNKDTAQGSRGSHFGGHMATSHREPSPPVEKPFSGLMSDIELLFPHQPYKYFSNKSFKNVDGFGSVFHKGVRCDGCGILPITGARFKSKVKYDFDLCSICFSRVGNVADYTRIDFPLPCMPSWSCKSTDPVMCIPLAGDPYMAQQHGATYHRPRLDSRFILDINVIDGTAMPPSMPFTKKWRMGNNGTLPWTSGLKLFWIGGDRFSPSDSVEIEVPVNGVPVGNELDIAVDFIAPELPGRYVSYWRMADPSGQKFGQRVWVLVQVDASMDLTHERTPTLNLNLPPDNSDQAGDIDDVLELFLGADDACAPTLEKNVKTEMGDATLPTSDDLLVPSDLVCPSSAPSAPSSAYPLSPVGTFVPYPIMHNISHNNSTSVPEDSSSTGESFGTSPNAKGNETNLDANSNTEQASERSGIEENLLKELEQMGFKQIDLNKEVLRMNEYDLERSVDDLCSVSEWDPILEELKEMGFEDKETNKKLLEKNNGSITRVVMDLIAEE